MSKILAVADIHLHDYAQRNPSEKYRLYQGLTVADNIVEAGKREGCDVIVFAGDVLENFLNRPYVLSVVKEFLDRIMSNFKQGYIIWGNHDQDNKGNDSEFNDCCLSVMLPKNLYYADKKETFISGRRLAFCNWRPEFDLSWISGKVDILFTHATINYEDGDFFSSQVLDESKFDLAVCGDIHKAAKKGKYVSIGNGQKCKMGDSDVPTGFVIDLETMEMKWTNLDPKEKLMKFRYSDVREEEGWDKATGTWIVYKPVNHKVSGGVKEIDIPEWKELEHLVKHAIDGHGLSEVHSDVLKGIGDLDSHEVDFNFTVTGLRIKNWRSIENFEQYLGEGDKVLILGENGSGKSSYLSAIKYALVPNPHYKDFIQFGAKECRVEVDFLYQGEKYTIIRGCTKTGSDTVKPVYGFKIDGVDQKYNNSKEFVIDMEVRFPFLKYTDAYFFNSDHPRLLGDLTPERTSEIMSKFYRLNRLETYHKRSKVLLETAETEKKRWESEIKTKKELLKFLETKLSTMMIPGRSKEELSLDYQKGMELQKAWSKWNDYVTKNVSLTARREELRKQKERIEPLVSNLVDYTGRVEELRNKFSWITEKTRKIGLIISEGSRLKKDLEDLGKQRVCSSCGRPLEPGEGLEAHKNEIRRSLERLREDLTFQYKELWESGIHDKTDINNGCTEALRSLQSELLDLTQKEAYQNNNLREFDRIRRDLEDTEKQFSTLGPEPPKVELPFDFWDIIRKIQEEIVVWNQLEAAEKDRNETINSIKICELGLNEVAMKSEQLQTYSKLTGPTGLILKTIMEKLADQFTDNQVTYKVLEYSYNRKDYLSLESYFNLGQNLVAYDNCSDGQRTLLDVDFLSKVATRLGILVMDEFLKHLDSKNHDVVIDKIKQMNIGCVIISSHMESIAAFNNKRLSLSLNDSGITKIEQYG